jgi:lysozyme
MAMKTSGDGVAIICQFERFMALPYMPTSHDVPTIGYGTTVYPSGKRVSLKDSAITERKARDYLGHDVGACEDVVHEAVIVPLTQGQFDALVSFVYNIGETAFDNSTLLKRLNAANYQAAEDEFLRWNKQAGRALKGLTRRRAVEQALFLKG